MKAFVAKQEPGETISELQSQSTGSAPTTTRRGRTGRSGHAPSPDEAASHRLGRAHRGERMIMLVHDLDVRVVSEDGVPLRISRWTSTETTNPSGPGDVYDAPTHPATMRRHITSSFDVAQLSFAAGHRLG
jgi:hypothetical protein